jgi:hypothetical protein
VSLPVAAAFTGFVEAPARVSMPPVSVEAVVVGAGEGSEFAPGGLDDLFELPHPARASRAAVHRPMAAIRRMA